jgi:hypothetical protein
MSDKEQISAIIEEERRGYIGVNYGRIEAVLGRDYWDEHVGDYVSIKNESTGELYTNPYEVDIKTLYKLGTSYKRMEMLGTVSITPFFKMPPDDIKRFGFLAGIAEKISSGEEITRQEREELFAGRKPAGKDK